MVNRRNDNRTNKGIFIGVSACLMGENKRYDGGHKKSALILNTLCSTLNCVSLCPEFAVGLGVPRNPISLSLDTENNIHAIMPGSHDVTEKIRQYAYDIDTELGYLSGYVLKSKSPSCGINSASLFLQKTQKIHKSDGIFTAQLRKYFPNLPICEETDLYNEDRINLFLTRVRSYQQETKLSFKSRY